MSVAERTTEQPMLRWSSTRDCPRKAVYEATGAPARERTDDEQRWLFRGRSIGRDYIIWLATKYGKVFVASGEDWWVPPHLRAASEEEAAILSEVPVRWPLGIGHIDGFLVETGTALEFLSSAHASDAMVRSKMVQVAGYAKYYEPALNACLIVLDPASLKEERFPIAFDTDAFRGLIEECDDRIAQVLEWRETGVMPARVCSKPSEARGHFCLHAQHCFEDDPPWSEPEPVAVVNDPEVIQRASLLHVAKTEERVAKDLLAEREKERKRLEAELVDAIPGAEGLRGGIRVGPFKLTRTHVQRSPSLDVKKATMAGVLNVEALAEYMKPGAEYWTSAIERVELDMPAQDLDFGDEAPWTDEDLAGSS